MRLMKADSFFIVPVLLILMCVGFGKAGGDQFENKTCEGLADCAHVNNSVCLENLCACPEDKPVFVNVTGGISEGVCLEARNHTQGNCSYNQQCTFEHSVCSDGVCGCTMSFNDDGEGACVENEKSAVIPIVVGSVIGLAILGTLLAYWWMSRRQNNNT